MYETTASDKPRDLVVWIGNKRWLTWNAVVGVFARRDVSMPTSLPGVRRAHHAWMVVYNGDDVTALVERVKAMQVEEALSG